MGTGNSNRRACVELSRLGINLLLVVIRDPWNLLPVLQLRLLYDMNSHRHGAHTTCVRLSANMSYPGCNDATKTSCGCDLRNTLSPTLQRSESLTNYAPGQKLWGSLVLIIQPEAPSIQDRRLSDSRLGRPQSLVNSGYVEYPL